MPLALITGAARDNSIGAGIRSALLSTGWEVASSDLVDADYVADLSDPDAPTELIRTVAKERGAISSLDRIVISAAY